MPDDIILVAADPARRIRASSTRWGRTAIGHSDSRQIFHVVGISESTGHILTSIDLGHIKVNSHGVWCRATPGLHAAHARLARTGYGLRAAFFREQLDIGAGSLANHGETIVVTHCPRGDPEWAGWRLTTDYANPMELDVLRPPADDPLALLEPQWPVHDLSGEVAVVGVGSIGSAAALALAMYGVQKITLVDDDRLMWHNLVRHQCTRHAVGQYKVDAVSDAIRSRWPAAKVLALRLNVIADADLMRPLFRRCALVLCAADGVAPRRVVSHLTRRAERTAILACVLMDGAIGEIVRLRPWPNDIKLMGNGHQPEEDPGQRGQPGGLAGFAGLVPSAGALGLAFVAASGPQRDEVAGEGDLEGEVGGEVVQAVRGKSIRSR